MSILIYKYCLLLKIYYYKFLGFFTNKFNYKYNGLLRTFITFYTKSGRERLARKLVKPIKRALNSDGIGRKLIMVDDSERDNIRNVGIIFNTRQKYKKSGE